MAEELVDVLTDDEVDALSEVVKPETVQALRFNKMSDREKNYARIVDGLIEDADSIKQPITIYKTFDNGSILKELRQVTEKAFLTGTASPSKENGEDLVTLAITVPSGTKVLMLPGGGYMLKRGLKLNLKAGGDNEIDATVKMALDVNVIMWPQTSTELHLIGQHDQSSHGSGGGGGRAARGATPGGEIAREQRLLEREKRLQRQQKLERKAERRRSRQQIVDTLLQTTAIIASIATIAGLLHQTGVIDLDQIGQNVQRRKNARNIRRSFG